MTVPPIDHLIGHRYRLRDRLGAGSMGAVYRATDRLTQTTVALKQVTTALHNLELAPHSPTPYHTTLNLALANEFQTLAALHHPNIIDVLDYGFDASGPYFTMEFLPDALTIIDAGRALPLLGRIDLLIQTLHALVYLHRHAITHRDLKPENILVCGGTLKVLDFGLSVKRDHAGELAGTLAYIAPEVLAGESATAAADLYAVGVIAYELFAGAHPFPAENTSQLIRAVMTEPPDLEALVPAFGGGVAAIVGKLLSKSPADRYTSAQAVIGALGQALERLDLTAESAGERESFLQAARFVGREREHHTLLAALDDVYDGRGSIWLIAGESGVGKTRLLDELRIPAMVKGALVLSVQGVPGGTQLYHFWRSPLRQLALSTPLNDLDASVLKTIVPDLDRLLGRPIPDAPPLEDRDARQRLALTIVSAFRAQPKPVVLLMDDLQWARESLLPLRELARQADRLPVLVVGSFRDDERPDIPGELPGAHVIKLERFPANLIEELSASILGDAGRQPHIVRFLERETEGNVFFMVETLRALAEQAGDLSAVTAIELPERMFPKGVQAIAQRHMERIPLDDHPLLRVAAVAGRQIDLNILRYIDPAVNLERWLLVCAEAGMIEVRHGQWQFAHNKLRDGILHGLADDQPPKLHRLVAQAIEALYPGDSAYTRPLVHHWHMAGNVPKEITYARQTGEQMMAVCDYHDALALFDRAITLAGSDPALAALHVQRADALYSTGDTAEARAVLEDILPTLRAHDDPGTLALAARILGNIMQVSGDYEHARRLMIESYELSTETGNQPGVATALRNLGLIAENLGQIDEAMSLYARSLDLFRAIDDRLGTAGALANLGSTAALRGQLVDAHARFEEALAIFSAIGYRWGYAYALIRLGEIAHQTGDDERATAALQESLDLCADIGHRWGMAYAQIQLGNIAHAQQRHRQAAAYHLRALRIAREINALPTALDALLGLIALLIVDEQEQRAADLLALVLEHPAAGHDTRRRAQAMRRALGAERRADAVALPDLDRALDDLLADCAAAGWE
jgi:tetratricopeptide (TPR) repeat protein